MVLNDAVLDRLAQGRVLVVGDCMLDAYLTGDAERISPEAPVPVVRIGGERYFLGGAGNVARNVAALGGVATLVGGIGDDASATQVRGLLNEHGVSCGLAPLHRPTTVKTRVMARRQQMLRLDKEDSRPYEADESRAVLDRVAAHLQGHDVLILSDYHKGLFTGAFMDGLRDLLAAKPIQVLVDPKPANVGLFSGVTLLTPNARETGECAGLPVENREQILAAGRTILARTGSRHLLSTLGPEGMALFVNTDEVWHIPTVARDVFDVTGAGDTVIATVGLSLAGGNDLLASCVLANYAAGIVVGRVGAATASMAELRESVGEPAHGEVTISRWV